MNPKPIALAPLKVGPNLKAAGNAAKVARPTMARVAAQKSTPIAPVAKVQRPTAAPTAPVNVAPGAAAVARLHASIQPTAHVLAPHVHQALSGIVQAPAQQQAPVQDVAEQPAAAVMTPANRYHVTPHGKPLFTSEGNYKAAYAFFSPYAKPGPYMTQLNAPQERAFDAWVQQYHVPFNTGAAIADYDMRGYWQSSGGKPYTQGTHFPDTWKTPYDTTFSRESKYSSANNPFDWVGQKLINIHTGKIIFEGSD